MKRKIVSCVLFIALSLTACGSRNNFAKTPGTESISENVHTSESLGDDENVIDIITQSKEVSLSGRAGTISVQIPEGWECISFPDCGDYE